MAQLDCLNHSVADNSHADCAARTLCNDSTRQEMYVCLFSLQIVRHIIELYTFNLLPKRQQLSGPSRLPCFFWQSTSLSSISAGIGFP